MFLLNKKLFEKTYGIIKGEIEMDPIFVELKEFVENTYGLTVYNVTYEKIPNGLFSKPVKNSYFYGKKYKLVFHIGSMIERETMQNRIPVKVDNFPNAHSLVNDEHKQSVILDKFFDLAKTHKFYITVKREDIWVDYHFSFTTDYMTYIVNEIEKKATKKILSEYKDDTNIWEIVNSGVGIHILYYTELDKEINAQKGYSEKIKNTYFRLIKELDDLNLYKEDYICFDTKENIDKNYQGSIYYYLR